MRDMISRSELLKQFPINMGNPLWHFTGIRAAIEAAPSVDAVPVVHARWTENGICTNCGNEAEYTEWVENLVDYDWDFNLRNFGEKVHRNHKLTNYCPNCGARMDGESEEEG